MCAYKRIVFKMQDGLAGRKGKTTLILKLSWNETEFKFER